MLFADRQEAGRLLSEKLQAFKNAENTVVLGLPRGGVVVAFEIARALHLPLDITIPRKIGAPGHGEYAIGAIDEEGEAIWNEEILAGLAVPSEYLRAEVERQKSEIERRLMLYRREKPALDISGKTVLVADDGVATGFTMRAAIRLLRKKNAVRSIAVTPVIARDTLEILRTEADDVVYLEAPVDFGAVGAFYQHFDQTTDQEVQMLLGKAQTD